MKPLVLGIWAMLLTTVQAVNQTYYSLTTTPTVHYNSTRTSSTITNEMIKEPGGIPPRSTKMPIWGIVVIVVLALFGSGTYVIFCVNTDEEGNFALPQFIKNKSNDTQGHVPMIEKKLGKLDDLKSDKSESRSSRSPKKEKTKAILTGASPQSGSCPTVPTFAPHYHTHQISNVDENRCANPQHHSSPKTSLKGPRSKKLVLFSKGTNSQKTTLIV